MPTRFKKINGSKFSYSILAKTVYGLAFAPPAMGITVKNVSSKSIKITPDCSLVVQRVTHSPIFLHRATQHLCGFRFVGVGLL